MRDLPFLQREKCCHGRDSTSEREWKMPDRGRDEPADLIEQILDVQAKEEYGYSNEGLDYVYDITKTQRVCIFEALC